MPVLPRVGDLFGRYRIDAQIGRGGMGVVYGATDTTIGRTVALKVVSVGLGDPARTEEFRLRFEREAAVLARLDSPHVIAIYDYGTHDDCPYIATQYVGGGDLGDLLASRGPMPAPLALRVCAQVADALHDAHRVGVVHRDVKPTNVLLRDADARDVHAYLCDFGIARTATDGITQAGAVAGTWSYLSPECGRGAPGSPASDIYALGCLLWAALSGAPPYRGSDVEVAVAHQRAPIPQLDRPDELSQRVDEILRRCLAKDPADRYASADQARVDLLAAASLPDPGTPLVSPPPDLALTMARPSGPPAGSSAGSSAGAHLSLGALPARSSPPTPPPGSQRRRTSVVVASVCAAVVAIAAGAYAISRATPDDPPVAAPSSTAPATITTVPTPDPAPTPTGPVRVDEGGPITGDLDGDGLGDLTISAGGTVTTWHSDGTALVQQDKESPIPVSTTAGYTQQVIGDFDGDEIAEVIDVDLRIQKKQLVLSGTLSGGGRVGGTVAAQEASPFVAVTDLDDDGSDDLVVAYVLRDNAAPIRFVAVPLDQGRPQRPALLLEVPSGFEDVAFKVGDFDGDGRGDIAVADKRSVGSDAVQQDLTIWLGDRRGVHRGPQRTFPGEILTSYLAADLDGDEDLELVVTDITGQSTALSVLDVRDEQITRPLTLGAVPRSGSYGDDFGVTDLDGDGRDDVVVAALTTPRQVSISVAESDGASIVPREVATWRRDFTKTDGYFSVSSRFSP